MSQGPICLFRTRDYKILRGTECLSAFMWLVKPLMIMPEVMVDFSNVYHHLCINIMPRTCEEVKLEDTCSILLYSFCNSNSKV